MTVASTSILPEALLQKCRERAPVYDRENRFFQEDFDELKAAGYLQMAVPTEFGGLGFNLAQVARETRRLAQYAPATALGLNMHNYWIGAAADGWRRGDRSMEWMLREAAAGEVFASAHAEQGNDLPTLLSTTKAERVDGGYRFTGRKVFVSLTPVWTRLGLNGMDKSDPSAPRIVHGFLPRETAGYTVKQTWDVMGMRATRSDDTILEGAFIPDKYVDRVVPAGTAGIDLMIIGFFTWAQVGFANVYYGLATRIREVLIEQLKKKTSIAMSRLVRPVRTTSARSSTSSPTWMGPRKWSPPTYTVTQYVPVQPAAQVYPTWSIHFITAPPCTLPPKFTSVGSARNRSVMPRGGVAGIRRGRPQCRSRSPSAFRPRPGWSRGPGPARARPWCRGSPRRWRCRDSG